MKRIGFIDNAKAIGILIVVYAHILLIVPGYAEFQNLCKIIYAFHMPLFFCISGFCIFYKYRDEQVESAKEIFLQKGKKILLPYFMWGIIYLVLEFIQGVTSAVIIERVYATITFRGVAPLWFLGMLFWAEITLLIVLRGNMHSRTKRICILSVICLVGMIVMHTVMPYLELDGNYLIEYPVVAFSRYFSCTFLVGAGYLLGSVFLKWQEKVNNIVKLIMGILCLALMCVIVVKTQNLVNMHWFWLGNIAVFLINAFLGVLGILMISCVIKENKICNWLSRNSLQIMVLHYPPLPAMTIVTYWAALRGTVNIGNSIIMMFVVMAITVLECKCLKLVKKYG